MADDPIRAALKRHALAVDAVVERFISDLDAVVARAQATVQNDLLRLLKLDHEHKVRSLPSNVRVLRRLPDLWQQALDSAGLQSVIQRYLDAFPGQLHAFQEILQTINQQIDTRFPVPTFGNDDKRFFNQIRISAGADLASLIDNAAANVVGRTASSGVSFSRIIVPLVKLTESVAPRAGSMAATSLTAFYRTVSQVGYQKIQDDQKQPLLYDYLGPDDPLTRPKCHQWVQRSLNRPFTGKEVDQLDNETQFMPVWQFGGGPRCRHSICISLRQTT